MLNVGRKKIQLLDTFLSVFNLNISVFSRIDIIGHNAKANANYHHLEFRLHSRSATSSDILTNHHLLSVCQMLSSNHINGMPKTHPTPKNPSQILKKTVFQFGGYKFLYIVYKKSQPSIP